MLVFGGLRLVPGGTDVSREVARAIAHAVEWCRGPAVIVFAGDTFDMLREGRPDPESVLAAHPRLAAALSAFLAAPERRIVVLPGIRDRALAYDNARSMRWIQPGGRSRWRACSRSTPAREFASCGWSPGISSIRRRRSPIRATPTTIRSSCTSSATCFRVLQPSATSRRSGWPASKTPIRPTWARSSPPDSRIAGCFAARPGSRCRYSRLLALFFPVVAFSSRRRNALSHVFRLLAAGFAIELILVVVALAFVVAQLHDSLGSLSWLSRALRDNDAPRGVGVGLAAGGGAGLITGHSGRAELTDLGGGAFYANCGMAARSVDRVETRGGLPAVYAARVRCSWVELEAGSELRVRLWHGTRELPRADVVGAARTRGRMQSCWPPAEVAEHPGIVTWPSAGDATAHRRRTATDRRDRDRVRRGLEPGVGGDRAVAVAPHRRSGRFDADRGPGGGRGAGRHLRTRLVAPGMGHAARSTPCVVARQRACCSLSVIGNVTKGLDIEESIIGVARRVFLVVHRDDFAAPANPSSWRRGWASTLAAVGRRDRGRNRRRGVAASEAVAAEDIAAAVAERMIGIKSVALPHNIDRLVSPALLAVGIAIALSFCWLLFRPAVLHPGCRRTGRCRASARASSSRSTEPTRCRISRCATTRSGSGSGDTLVAYRVHNGVALVSPDPVGPVGQRAESWGAFREFADEHGWPVAVMGASADWLPVYAASGMHDLYIGDEAVVDVRRFSLEGKQNKSLRQSVGRVEKAGLPSRGLRPVEARARTRDRSCRALMTESRRGDVERGFSMTLGRVFEPDDQGLLARGRARRRRPPGRVLSVRARVGDQRMVARPDAPQRGRERAERHHRVHRRQDDRAPPQHGFGRARAQLRDVPGGARERSRRPPHAARAEVDPRARRRFDADRVAVDVQREVPARMASALRGLRLARSTCSSASIAVARAESFFEIPIIGRFFKPSGDDVAATSRVGRG